MKSVCLLALIATLRLATSIQADTPAFTSGGYTATAPPSFTGTKGWSFYYDPNNPIVITQLGVFDSGADGLQNEHRIGVWTIQGTLLASATVSAGSLSPLVDNYRYASITPLYLPGGSAAFGGFIIAAQYSAGDADDSLTPMPSGIAPGIAAWSGSLHSIGRYGFGSDLPFPNYNTQSPSEGSIGPAFWEANFQFVGVPEPSAMLLLAPGLLWFFLRRGKAVATGR